MKLINFVITLLSCFIPAAYAQCIDTHPIGRIDFETNSSYFNDESTQLLNSIAQTYMETTDTKEGHLLLAFQMNKEQSEDLNKYNLWLAQRRVERVKQHLVNSHFSVPIISQIRTSTDDESRAVNIHWCSSPTEVNIDLAKATKNDSRHD